MMGDRVWLVRVSRVRYDADTTPLNFESFVLVCGDEARALAEMHAWGEQGYDVSCNMAGVEVLYTPQLTQAEMNEQESVRRKAKRELKRLR